MAQREGGRRKRLTSACLLALLTLLVILGGQAEAKKKVRPLVPNYAFTATPFYSNPQFGQYAVLWAPPNNDPNMVFVRGWVLGPTGARRCESVFEFRKDIRLEQYTNGVLVNTFYPTGASPGQFNSIKFGVKVHYSPMPAVVWDVNSTYRVVADRVVFKGLYLQRLKHGKVSKKYELAPPLICPARILDLGSPVPTPISTGPPF